MRNLLLIPKPIGAGGPLPGQEKSGGSSSEGGPRTILLAPSGGCDRPRTWRVVRVGALMVLAALAFVVSVALRNLHSEVAELKARIRAGNTNMLRLQQQLDEVFRSQSQRWRSGAPLSADDRKLLRIWLTFDTSYVVRNRHDRSLRCEVALAHQRAGECGLWLGDSTRSIRHLQESLRFYEELASSHPSAADYHADMAWAHALLGDAMAETGETHEAIRAYREAIALLAAPGFPRTADDDQHLSEWTERLNALTQVPSTRLER